MKKIKEWKTSHKIIAIILIVVIVAVVVLGVYIARKGKELIDDIDTAYGDTMEYNNYYSGVVEAQKTWNINLDSSRELDQTYVSEGDIVTVGQPLLLYKVTEQQTQLASKRLEIESLSNEITEYNNQIVSLQGQLEGASEMMKLEISSQISDCNASIKQAQMSQKTLNAEIADLQKTIDNATVVSKMDGVVKSISENTGNSGEPYMVILATGQYRVKASVDELNVSMLSEGMEVEVHSRVDENKVWKGKISEINTGETNNQTNNNGGGMEYSTDSSGVMNSENGATKYTFYVTMDDTTGLLLGQHVYVTPVYDDSMMDGSVPRDDGSVIDDALPAGDDANTENAGDDNQSTGN
ncbi:MAG: HlyD family efflux transporter periplasmic adaptor subunit [Lachnospiraceae bacterium]|nr:HlyD family efflux transporter periplasmic adaptor subunit [Lachnospiraceae bacterium]